MKKAKAEAWKSDQNEEEIHFFDGKHYIMGFNPAYVNKRAIAEFLALVTGFLTPDGFLNKE